MKVDRKGKSLYHCLVPKFIRKPIRDHHVKQTILNYYGNLSEELINQEQKTALNYLKHNKISVFPYPFQENYKRNDIKVYKDEELKLKYVLLNGKRLYFKRTSSTRGVKRNYSNLLMEQDINSPHRYLTNSFDLGGNDVFVDIGAGEGNLALSVIEKVKTVYLFETDENWIEALKATFSPWKDKVIIVNKNVSGKNDDRNTTLDQFFKDKEQFDFLKIDAEGGEAEILIGCKALLSSNQQLKIALCCYHKPNDEFLFNELLEKKGFSVSFTKGYMIFYEPETFSPPYLRRGILRAEK